MSLCPCWEVHTDADDERIDCGEPLVDCRCGCHEDGRELSALRARVAELERERDEWQERAGATVVERSELRERVAEVERENTALRGITPDFPPRPLHGEGNGMPRYGLRFNGPTAPFSVPMADGYWTPWHLAQRRVVELERDLKAANAELERWRHGREIEGDYVCPDSLRADAAEQRVRELEQTREHLREDWYAEQHRREAAEQRVRAADERRAMVEALAWRVLTVGDEDSRERLHAALAASESEADAAAWVDPIHIPGNCSCCGTNGCEWCETNRKAATAEEVERNG